MIIWKTFAMRSVIYRCGGKTPGGSSGEEAPRASRRHQLRHEDYRPWPASTRCTSGVRRQQQRASRSRCCPPPAPARGLARTVGSARCVSKSSPMGRCACGRRPPLSARNGAARGAHERSAALTTRKQPPETVGLQEGSCVPRQQALRHLDRALRTASGTRREERLPVGRAGARPPAGQEGGAAGPLDRWTATGRGPASGRPPP